MKNDVLKLVASSVLTTLSGAAMAHEGHGSAILAIHTMEHGLVVLGALAALSIAVVWYRNSKRQDDQR